VLFTFKKEYKPLIVSGRKTQTVRIWKRCWLRQGQVVKSPCLGRLRIDEVTQLKLGDLTQEDARRDGFNTKAQLLEALKRIYNLKNAEGAMCYRVRFKYLGDSETKDKAPGKGGARPGKTKRVETASKGRRKSKPAARVVKKSTKRKAQSRTSKTKPGKQETLFPPF
jgi:hypothetical protein